MPNPAILTWRPPAGSALSFFGSTLPSSIPNDTLAVAVGFSFQSTAPVTIIGWRKAVKSGNSAGTLTGKLWTIGGTELASSAKSISNVFGAHWEEDLFTSPVTISADTFYVLSVHATANIGFSTGTYLNTDTTVGTMTIPKSSTAPSPGNGRYKYGDSTSFPDQMFNNVNYWVDATWRA